MKLAKCHSPDATDFRHIDFRKLPVLLPGPLNIYTMGAFIKISIGYVVIVIVRNGSLCKIQRYFFSIFRQNQTKMDFMQFFVCGNNNKIARSDTGKF